MIQRIDAPNGARMGTTRLSDQDLLSLSPPRSGRRDVGVGIFVVVGVLAALIALFTLTDASTFRGRYVVTANVPDAGGLRRGDPVQMRGVNIGRVQRFDIGAEGVAVRLELEGEYDVPADSRVELRSNGLLGGMVAEVVPGRSNEDLRDGDVVVGSTVAGAFDAAANVGTRADAVLGQVQTLLSEKTVAALGSGAVELQSLLTELALVVAEQRRELNTLTASLNRTAGGFEKVATGPELARAAARADTLMARLDSSSQRLDRVSGSLETILGRMERGEGTLGKLSQDDALYTNLNTAASELNLLVADIRKDPRKYLSVSVF